MCEQTPVEYKAGDIVWVKLRPCWWPGEVQEWNDLPTEVVVDFKKRPLAAVKFFQEESFEFVKNINQIYSYNCKKKIEFIKKGLDLFRAKNVFMDKFPEDIGTAETKTGGDPDILNSSLFQSDKKTNYAALVFGSPSPKRALKDSNRNSRGRPSLKLTPSPSKRHSSDKVVTHRRFTGHDDHEVRVLLQPTSTPEPETQTMYRCPTCGFESCRIDVIVMHNKSHIQGVYSTPTSTTKRIKKSPVKSHKKIAKLSRPKTTVIRHEEDSFSEDEDEPKPKKKRKSQLGKRKQKKTDTKDSKETTVDIKNDLLAEWEEESEPEEDTSTLSNISFGNVSNEKDKKEEANKDSKVESTAKSCFDFDDDEDNQIVGTSVGRKIPRVIPQSEKSKDDPMEDEAIIETEESPMKKSNKTSSADNATPEKSDTSDSNKQDEPKLDEFEDLMESTALPDLPQIPQPLKYEQNFHSAKTIKFPDKLKDNITDKKAMSPPRKKIERIETDAEKLVTSPKKFEIVPVKVSTTPKEQTVTKEETGEGVTEKKLPTIVASKSVISSSSPVDPSPTTQDVKETTSEVATKLTNPKKRFVKTFEDLEQLQSEQKKQTELQKQDSTSSTVEVSKLKTQLMSKLSSISDHLSSREKTVFRPATYKKLKKLKRDDDEDFQTTAENITTSLKANENTPESLESVAESPKIKIARKSRISETTEAYTKSQDEPQKSATVTKPQNDSMVIEHSSKGAQRKESFKYSMMSPKSYSSEDDKQDKSDSETEFFKYMKRKQQTTPNEPVLSPTTSTRYPRKWRYRSDPDPEESNSTIEPEETKLSPVRTRKEMTKSYSRSPKAIERVSDQQEKTVEDPVPVHSKTNVHGSDLDVLDSYASKRRKLRSSSSSHDEEKQDGPHESREQKSSRSAKYKISSHEIKTVDKPVPDIVKMTRGNRRRSSVKTFEESSTVSKQMVETEKAYDNLDTFEAKLDLLNIEKTDNVAGEIQLNEKSHKITKLTVEAEDGKAESVAIKKSVKENDKNVDAQEVVKGSSAYKKRDKLDMKKFIKNSGSHVKEILPTTVASVSMENISTSGDKEPFSALSVLSTLATESELSNNLERSVQSGDKTKQEGSFTVVTETDLGDCQVEIANVSVAETVKTKPLTLSSFSVDFCDPNQANNVEVTHEGGVKTDKSKKQLLSQVKEDVAKEDGEKKLHKVYKNETSKLLQQEEPKHSLPADGCDLEDQIPPLIVNKESTVETEMAKLTHSKPEESSRLDILEQSTSSSKLLEILTDPKPKSSVSQLVPPIKSSNPIGGPIKKVQMPVTKEIVSTSKTIPKYETKNSKFVIKSASSGKVTTTPTTSKTTKPVILSEKIIKPISETDNVSVQKVTSSKTSNDIEDIATFIIQRSVKKSSEDDSGSDSGTTVQQIKQSVKKQVVPMKGRGKARILQQTIITPAGDVIQPNIQQVQTDENMFDINSMPIVMGDQILTPESIENMPVVLSDASPAVTTSATIVKKTQPQQVKLLNKSATSPGLIQQSTLIKPVMTPTPQKLNRTQKVYQASSSKLLKTNPAIITQAGKPGKFIIVPAGSSTPTGMKYTVGKRPPVVKRSTPVVLPATPVTKIQSVNPSPEPTGNKIMIVTNQQGQQSRVLLTPAQQKMLGYQTTPKTVKTSVKSNILQKAIPSKTTILSPLSGSTFTPKANIISHTVVNSKGQVISSSGQNLITSDGQVLTPLTPQQLKGLKTDPVKGNKKVQMHSQRVLLQGGLSSIKGTPSPGQPKTIVIKNQQGQIVKRIQGTDDALLEQQVAEQVQAIKASSSFSNLKAQSKHEVKPVTKLPVKKSYPKKSTITETISKPTSKAQVLLNAGVTSTLTKVAKTEAPPPLAPISPTKKVEPVSSLSISAKVEESTVAQEENTKGEAQQRPLQQLVIQDGLGNQTVITEGQILAIPSETVDGQPHSYMLVTLDESGSLTPLNNEALLSLDPNLGLGGDLSNMVLQLEDGSITDVNKQATADAAKTKNVENNVTTDTSSTQPTVVQNIEQPQIEHPTLLAPALQEITTSAPEQLAISQSEQVVENATVAAEPVISIPQATENAHQNLESVHVTCSISNEPNQQLIITGDPISTQKFIESLTEGNADLANLLASAEGNILIQTDGQQILINTDSENQLLLPMGSENLNMVESTEGGGNPIFASQPVKNQDILAAALADTDVPVFQQEHTTLPGHSKLSQSQLSPGSSLYPMNVGNILEPTLTINSPIMTPLEIPSTNNKKIPDEESDILTTEVPKNIDLPITITDPNISQTVAQQQAASLMASELQSNLDLPPLSIADTTVTVTSTEMNSPSYGYSLPTLDEPVDISQKPFSGSISMPLLTEEEPEEAIPESIETGIGSDSIEAEPTENSSLPEVTSKENDGISVPSTLEEPSPSIEIPEVCSKLPSGGLTTESSFMSSVDDGLCTLGGEMCSSLSEPPPDMFDLSVMHSNYVSNADIKEASAEVNEDNSKAVVEENTESAKVDEVEDDVKPKPSTNAVEDMNDDKKNSLLDAEITNNESETASTEVNSESNIPSVVDSHESSLDIPVQPQVEADLSSGILIPDVQETINQHSPLDMDENSFEIPVQPQIVTDLSSAQFEINDVDKQNNSDLQASKRSFAEDDETLERKKSKFD